MQRVLWDLRRDEARRLGRLIFFDDSQPLFIYRVLRET